MDVERARFNMVESQIRTWGVLEPAVLEALFRVHREDFVPPAYRSLAFSDLEIPLTVEGEATGEILFTPKTEARLLQELAVHKTDSVLEIGAGSGHMAALLAQQAREVLSLEIHPLLARFAAANLARAGISHARVQHQDGSSLDPQHRYDVIVLSGSVAFVPEFLLKALQPGGRLAAIVGDAPVMQAQIIERVSESGWSARTIFETVAPRLHGFAEHERFRF